MQYAGYFTFGCNKITATAIQNFKGAIPNFGNQKRVKVLHFFRISVIVDM